MADAEERAFPVGTLEPDNPSEAWNHGKGTRLVCPDRLARALQAKWLMALGTIAYGLYLIHYPVFLLAVYAMRTAHVGSGLVVVIVALPLTVLIAEISWKWFEKPFVRLGHRAQYSGRRGSAAIVAVVPAPEPLEE